MNEIKKMTRENISQIADGLLNLEEGWTNIGETPWTQDNFQQDLPGKWDLSGYITEDGILKGYYVGSHSEGIGKLHKILVSPEFRGKGVSKELWLDFLNRARALNLERLEFKVLQTNEPAINLYRNQGCLIEEPVKGTDLKLRNKVEYFFRSQIPLKHSKPTISNNDVFAYERQLISGGLASGEKVREFEAQLGDMCSMAGGVATNSGTNALFLALKAIGKTGEVIIPDYMCASPLLAITQAGYNPVLVDVDPDYNINFENVKNRVSNKTRAIIVPHMFGKPVQDMWKILDLGVPVIEDCAHAVGARLGDVPVGSFGDYSIFSFYATKMMTTGVGGMVLAREEKDLDKLRDLTKCDERETLSQAYSFKMSDLQAMLGISQLSQLGDFITSRRNIARDYEKYLRDSEFELPQQNGVWFRYVVRTKEVQNVIDNLNSRGIEVKAPVFKPLHRYYSFSDDDFPESSQAYYKALSLPIYPSMTPEQTKNVASALRNWKHEK